MIPNVSRFGGKNASMGADCGQVVEKNVCVVDNYLVPDIVDGLDGDTPPRFDERSTKDSVCSLL